jgi:aldose 1-epimerase
MNKFSKKPTLYTLTNSSGTEVKVTNFGAIVTSIRVVDREGNLGEVVLGFDEPEEYQQTPNPYFGAVVGRFANRIANGRFPLDGREYRVSTNDRENHLHGGDVGFDKVFWTAMPISNGIMLCYLSKDGEEGYPGNLAVAVAYTLNEANKLVIHYWAITDQPTVVNLSQHTYFNLVDGGASDILSHELFIDADQFVAIDDTGIPTGELVAVQGTPFDFTVPMPIGARINQEDPQLRNGFGYDHNWILNRRGSRPIATLFDSVSGRFLEVVTTEPGLQFYSGNFLDGSITGRNGCAYHSRSGLCLETQHFPDSPNQPTFPSTVLRPGEIYEQQTSYRFSVVRF